jgi:hypothetical protein
MGASAPILKGRIMANNKPVGVAYSDPALTAFYLNAPVTKTASFSLGDSDNYVVCNGSAANVSVTLPSGSDYIGRTVTLKNLSGTYTVISASSNVKPLTSATAGTAILAATAGKWATLVCEDGTNWVIMAAG